jgi:alkanesulfonate monooxygenase SsuD/methylene tetrahydromethanopterin reductase-like flavin-dependent oxidoreductase (luciferase family)
MEHEGKISCKVGELLRKLTIFGRPESVKGQLNKWQEHGATQGALLLNPGLSIEQYDLILESFI